VAEAVHRLHNCTKSSLSYRTAELSARDNGVRLEELIETITHLAFYSGWPNAMTAITVAKKVFQKN
jgi:carboxymuconolactone decarboxylase family protein